MGIFLNDFTYIYYIMFKCRIRLLSDSVGNHVSSSLLFIALSTFIRKNLVALQCKLQRFAVIVGVICNMV